MITTTLKRLCACLFVFAVAAHAIAAPPINLPAKARGERAIMMLGDRLPDVARMYGKDVAEMKRLLRQENDLWIDRTGKLLYVCEGMKIDGEKVAAAEPVDDGDDAASAEAADDTFLLHSQPGASKVIYLDFDGHTTTGTYWNTYENAGKDIVSAPYSFEGDSSFSDAELLRIRYIWQRVVEDYAPFNVDVTTEDPGVEALRRSSPADQDYGVRVVISPTSSWYPGAGGVAYVGSFIWSTDTPCFVFSGNLGNGHEKYTAEATAHEVGHTVGLYHDGAPGTGYYEGHGTGETGWAPIMGVGYYKNLVQWSKGEYPGANNQEDDLAIIQTYGLAYLGDDHGDAATSATNLPASTTLAATGVIGQNTDTDVFMFAAGPGTVSIELALNPRSPDLDALIELRDDGGALVASSNPVDALAASLNATVAGGNYYLSVTGVGKGDLTTGYSDYASLGEYTISGTVPDPTGNVGPVAVATANPTTGNVPLTVAFTGDQSYDQDGQIVSYAWTFGDGGTSTEANPTHIYQAEGVYEATLTVTDNDDLTGTDSVTITVTVPNDPPVAVATVMPATGHAPLTVTLDGSASNDIDGEIVSYAWNFGDGSTGNGAVLEHTYEAIGTYEANLTVTDDRGATATDAVTVTVTQDPGKIIFVNGIDLSVIEVPGGKAGSAIVYVVDGAGAPVEGVAVSAAWSGVVSGSETVVTGPYGMAMFTSRKTKKSGTITFTVTNLEKTGYIYDAERNVKTTASVSTDTQANQRPTAVASADPTQGQPPLTVNFDGSQSTDPEGEPLSYNWNFGDGATATGATAQHIYQDLGTYDAVLTVTDSQGATDTDSVTISATDGTVVDVYVENIAMAVVTMPGKRTGAEATVTVKDTNGTLVSGASVSGTWTGLASGTSTAVTNANGQAVLSSKATRDKGTFTITVDNIAKAGTAYNSALNVETTDSISN